MSLDLGDFALDSDKYGLSLYRKKIRINSKTQESTQYLDPVGYYGTFAQVTVRLAHLTAAEAMIAGASVAEITAAVDAAASRIESAINQPQGAKS